VHPHQGRRRRLLALLLEKRSQLPSFKLGAGQTPSKHRSLFFPLSFQCHHLPLDLFHSLCYLRATFCSIFSIHPSRLLFSSTFNLLLPFLFSRYLFSFSSTLKLLFPKPLSFSPHTSFSHVTLRFLKNVEPRSRRE
jgi:hypothetical protein